MERVALLAAGLLGASLLAVASTARASVLPDSSELAAAQVRLAGEVEIGIQRTNARWWWNGWYRDYPDSTGYSSIWSTVHLFEAYAGLQAAAPSTRHRNMLVWYAAKTEGYGDKALSGGFGGFSTGYAQSNDPWINWFDDNGWLGLAFFDAYQLTGKARFLRDAEQAFAYLYQVGWDPVGGGIWWNTAKSYKCAESVNTAALLAVLLYQRTGEATYLKSATTLIDWANANLFDAGSGLYLNHPGGDGVAIDYNESPMLDALARLCGAKKLYCDRVRPLTDAMLAAYDGSGRQQPQYDGMYVRYLVDAYSVLRDARLFSAAYAYALRVERNALDPDGFYVRNWDGGQADVNAGLISTHGAGLEAMAWAAAGATQAAQG